MKVSRAVQDSINQSVREGRATEGEKFRKPRKYVRITLPWPPSVNSCYRAVNGRVVLSKRGRQYPKDVAAACTEQQIGSVSGRLEVTIWAFPGSKRKADIDNLLKSCLDSLCKAGVFEDDSQVSMLTIHRCGVHSPGFLTVEITGETP